MAEKEFFDYIRSNLFNGSMTQKQVDGVNRFLGATDGMDITHRAYILATVFHETGARMQPVRETFADTDQQAVNRLDNAWAKGQLPWVKTPYWRPDSSGKSWFGRGDVQVTHKENYAKAGDMVGADLLGDPGKLLDPSVSSRVAVEGMKRGIFTGQDLSDYLPGDYYGARRIINGTESASKVAAYAGKFEESLRVLGETKVPVVDAVPTPAPAPATQPSIWAAVVALFRAIFGGKK